MPFALVQLCLWPACLDSSEHAAVTITDNALGIAGQRAQEGLQLAGLALVNASVSQSLGLPATKPTPQKTSKATLPAGIRLPLGSRARTRKGRWSSSSDPCVGQAVGGKGGTTPVARTPPQWAGNCHDSTRAARRSQYRT